MKASTQATIQASTGQASAGHDTTTAFIKIKFVGFWYKWQLLEDLKRIFPLFFGTKYTLGSQIMTNRLGIILDEFQWIKPIEVAWSSLLAAFMGQKGRRSRSTSTWLLLFQLPANIRAHDADRHQALEQAIAYCPPPKG